MRTTTTRMRMPTRRTMTRLRRPGRPAQLGQRSLNRRKCHPRRPLQRPLGSTRARRCSTTSPSRPSARTAFRSAVHALSASTQPRRTAVDLLPPVLPRRMLSSMPVGPWPRVPWFPLAPETTRAPALLATSRLAVIVVARTKKKRNLR
jgi:hypothetical protein